MTLPEPFTYGAVLDLCCKCETAEEAQEILDALVQRSLEQDPNRSPEEALKIVKSNIGYLGGYCGVDAQARFQRLFGAVHPVFGRLE